MEKSSGVICAIPSQAMAFPTCPPPCLPSPSLTNTWRHPMQLMGWCELSELSRTGDWECFGLALDPGVGFCQGRVPWSHLGFKEPSGTQSALPSPCDTDKTSRGKISSKVCLFLWNYCRRKRKPSGNHCVQARERSFNNSFLRAVLFWSSQPSKHVFSGLFPLPLTFTS